MADISREEVAHLAELARLDLSEEELAHLSSQIDGIVENVSGVRAVDTEGVEPMSHPHASEGATRKDEVGQPAQSVSQDEALDQAPDARDERFGVPRIQ